MPRDYASTALRDLRTLFEGGAAAGLTDAELLARYAARRAESAGAGAAAEAAFAALVDRHGPMVWGVCRRILGDAHEAEDAFQATFLVLVRRAGSVRVGDSLGRWLHGVARRVALRARAQARRRECFRADGPPGPDAGADLERALGELGAAVGEEVGRLPPRQRAVVELCHLRGLTNEEAARHLGWPVGTVKSRLARGRERLGERLARRGLAPAGGALVGAVTVEAGAAVPPMLARSTLRLVSFSAAGGSGASPGPVVALAEGAMRAMALKNLMLAAVAACGLAATGAGVFAFQAEAPRQGAPGTPQANGERAPSGVNPKPAVPGELTKPEGTVDVTEPTGPANISQPAVPVDLTEPSGPSEPPQSIRYAVRLREPDDVVKRVQDMAEKVGELRRRGRFAESADVLRDLAEVVRDWEAELRAMARPPGGDAPTGTGKPGTPGGPHSSDRPVLSPGSPEGFFSGGPKGEEARVRKGIEAGYVAPSAARGPSLPPSAPGGPGRPGDPPPEGADQERRLRRVEGLLEELLRRLDPAPAGQPGPARR